MSKEIKNSDYSSARQNLAIPTLINETQLLASFSEILTRMAGEDSVNEISFIEDVSFSCRQIATVLKNGFSPREYSLLVEAKQKGEDLRANAYYELALASLDERIPGGSFEQFVDYMKRAQGVTIDSYPRSTSVYDYFIEYGTDVVGLYRQLEHEDAVDELATLEGRLNQIKYRQLIKRVEDDGMPLPEEVTKKLKEFLLIGSNVAELLRQTHFFHEAPGARYGFAERDAMKMLRFALAFDIDPALFLCLCDNARQTLLNQTENNSSIFLKEEFDKFENLRLANEQYGEVKGKIKDNIYMVGRHTYVPDSIPELEIAKQFLRDCEGITPIARATAICFFDFLQSEEVSVFEWPILSESHFRRTARYIK